ncbi:MAG: sigma-54-dependent Fis family transcriptional regulator [Verrucomicrobia bacterium]|nr:MAG: sigma-54-dependent Fis family transcriptional regulator [Verrucomicrobiota bacterium]RLE21952.1 MAG: sigma-54-dependent Fis family transcriptional regulator [Acidobacteriota bacterium]
MPAEPKTSTILVIDDDSEIRYSLDRVLASRGFKVQTAASGEEGLEVVKGSPPDVVFLDIRMGGISGIETLQHLRGIAPKMPIILMTAYGTAQTAIEAMKFGAFDYIMKPFDPDRVISLAEGAVRAVEDMNRAGDYESLLNSDDYEEGIVGHSPAMQEVFKIIGQVAASDVTVLVSGESGTGKELIARCVWQHSHRNRADFVAVNCAAIPDNLIESELFGHEKGSFTGATGQRIGKFEQCDRGTIFLDEIGDMALSTQTKILRVLQEGEIQRVGGSETIKVDIRVIAATNKGLEDMVEEKTFREDLYYRLNVVRIRVPPLRERKEDIPEIVDYMLQMLEKERKIKVRKVSPEALSILCACQWPGNVRELENVVYRSAVVAQGDAILIKDLPEEIAGRPVETPAPEHVAVSTSQEASETKVADPVVGDASKTETGDQADMDPLGQAVDALYAELKRVESKSLLRRLERELVERAFIDMGNNQARTAELLGMTRTTLKKRLQEYGLAK